MTDGIAWFKIALAENLNAAQTQERFVTNSLKDLRPDQVDAVNLPFFVYGTLRTGMGNYAWALAGKTDSEVLATIAGVTMYDGGFPYVAMTEESLAAGTTVVGDVMTINDDTTFRLVLAELDHLEGYAGPDSTFSHYERVMIDAQTDAGVVRAYTYLASPKIHSRLAVRDVIASGDWCTDGARFQRR